MIHIKEHRPSGDRWVGPDDGERIDRMRATGLCVLLLLPACSADGDTTNSVDVSAAASRAERDIANYAAERRGGRRPQPTPRAAIVTEPNPSPASGGPVRATPAIKSN
ncbi:hypothetical protein [uncultured Sphingomonas sp.]|uniref:hypothetical protein n=1 Tax=uncultured Sphingomonas sp. TaxID=158754 RepID=UPI0035CBF77A